MYHKISLCAQYIAIKMQITKISVSKIDKITTVDKINNTLQ